MAIDTPPSLVVGNVKSYFSGHYQHYGVNVQAVCDHLCHFTYFAFASPGSVNDRDAIKGTSLPSLLHNVPAGFVIIGDAAYEASEKIVSLFYGVDALIPENDNFNFYGSIRIEMAFGMMSQKWGILKLPLSGDIKFTAAIAICVAHLHNFTINERLKKETQQAEQDTIDLLFQEHCCNITWTE